jgi:hypothetical protein
MTKQFRCGNPKHRPSLALMFIIGAVVGCAIAVAVTTSQLEACAQGWYETMGALDQCLETWPCPEAKAPLPGDLPKAPRQVPGEPPVPEPLGDNIKRSVMVDELAPMLPEAAYPPKEARYHFDTEQI